MKQKDILIHYMVTKKENEKTNIEKIIQSIIVYIQSNPIYFEYEPKFVNNILIFGIIGFKRDHVKLQKRLGDYISYFGGNLKILTKKEN
jgi:hypothetical protein